MQCVVLCGGEGIASTNGVIPKTLMEVDGTPIIMTLLKSLFFYDMRDIILCTGIGGDKIKDYLNSSNNTHDRMMLDEMKISFVTTGENSGTGHRILKTKDLITDDFLLCYSDFASDLNITKLRLFHERQDKLLTMTGVHPTTPLGVIAHENGKVVRYDTNAPTSSAVKGGYFVCKKDIFSYLGPEESCIFEKEPLQNLISNSEVVMYEHFGFWKHFDTPKQVLELEDSESDKTHITWEIRNLEQGE